MEVRLLNKGKNHMELELKGADETLLHPLKTILSKDDKVSLATYTMGHPSLDCPKLYVKVSDGKPQAALKRAAKALSNEYKNLYAAIEKKK